MRKQINFIVPDNHQLTKKVIDYFIQFDFKLVEHNGEHLKFGHSSTLFDTWETNPLKWHSEIAVLISGNKVVADFSVDTDAQMNTKEEDTIWQTFIENFQNYLTNGIVSNSKLHSTIIDNRKSRKSYIVWAVLGALTGGLLGLIHNKLTNGNSTLSVFLPPILAIIFLTWRINYTKTKNAL